ncbi:hypothetical protein BO94DRAFT_252218 [Aspergillus sclerotioniger CBS 115572]|uniref:Uncharacterized protein n=1 Tax=Aspergillus sclerotioniger CBS 115572 TaxID=1450535 RepID=A0A317VE15_9EURO|nr:hypothetical protein BO94DRAFT_252218 [Aspergillus sclerotioniger CBS 115572]PWY72195.1 hypothetical protein BO94DRAFT_252218 [Aspergillus sclerotioniger CBS 115572]
MLQLLLVTSFIRQQMATSGRLPSLGWIGPCHLSESDGVLRTEHRAVTIQSPNSEVGGPLGKLERKDSLRSEMATHLQGHFSAHTVACKG